MYTYQVVVHPKGKHLFTADIRDIENAKQVYADMVKFYGKESVTITKWSVSIGTNISNTIHNY